MDAYDGYDGAPQRAGEPGSGRSRAGPSAPEQGPHGQQLGPVQHGQEEPAHARHGGDDYTGYLQDIKKAIQKQLLLLLHAQCQRLGQANGEVRQCNRPHCRSAKNVLNHMTHCQADKSCQVVHCWSSRQIISHCKDCTRHDCPICPPLKNAGYKRILASLLTGAGAVLGGSLGVVPGGQPSAPNFNPPGQIPPSVVVASGRLPTATPPSAWLPTATPPSAAGTRKSWHEDITQDLRNILVHKIMQVIIPTSVIFPTSDPAALKDPWMANIMAYAREKEGDMYQSANSRAEYYHLVAEHMYMIKKELEKKRRTRLPTATPPSAAGTRKSWHEDITQDLRNILVHKIMQVIFPTSDPAALKDPRMANIMAYAREKEGDMYQSANSRAEYYHLVAEHMYMIKKELEKKRRTRRRRMRRLPPTGMPPVG